jgi:hypothetical protein
MTGVFHDGGRGTYLWTVGGYFMQCPYYSFGKFQFSENLFSQQCKAVRQLISLLWQDDSDNENWASGEIGEGESNKKSSYPLGLIEKSFVLDSSWEWHM